MASWASGFSLVPLPRLAAVLLVLVGVVGGRGVTRQLGDSCLPVCAQVACIGRAVLCFRAGGGSLRLGLRFWVAVRCAASPCVFGRRGGGGGLRVLWWLVGLALSAPCSLRCVCLLSALFAKKKREEKEKGGGGPSAPQPFGCSLRISCPRSFSGSHMWLRCCRLAFVLPGRRELFSPSYRRRSLRVHLATACYSCTFVSACPYSTPTRGEERMG